MRDLLTITEAQNAEAYRLAQCFRAGHVWPSVGPYPIKAEAKRCLRDLSGLAPRCVGGRSYLLPIDATLDPLYKRVGQGDRTAAADLGDHLRSRGISVPLALEHLSADLPHRDDPREDLYARVRAACDHLADGVWLHEAFAGDDFQATRWLEQNYCPELGQKGMSLAQLRPLHEAFPDEAVWKGQRYDHRKVKNLLPQGRRAARRDPGGSSARGRITLPLGRLRLDGDTQARAALDPAVVGEYAQAMARGDRLPPVRAVFDGRDYWLWDGFHTFRAREARGYPDVECKVTDGTVEDARWLARGANRKHGLQRTDADEGRAVTGALRMRPDLSDREIAEHCGVDPETVAAARREEESPAGDAPPGPAEGGPQGIGLGAIHVTPEGHDPGMPTPAVVYDPDDPDFFGRPDLPDLHSSPLGDLTDLLLQAVRAHAVRPEDAGGGGGSVVAAPGVQHLLHVLGDRFAAEATRAWEGGRG